MYFEEGLGIDTTQILPRKNQRKAGKRTRGGLLEHPGNVQENIQETFQEIILQLIKNTTN
ncbi:MAG: hypothetical protein BGO34_08410 [Bacteroidia bacterium 44-10]|nr:MAG: hypothetical protein BGO34_08410 [Bacteroidia bacterium 44-10]